MAKLNRSKLQRLAKTRLDDARALLRIRRFGAAYYFAGYVVELGLKACIARQTRRFDFPERQSPRDDSNLYTHNLANLLKLADVPMDKDCHADAVLARNWAIVKDWNEQTRYDSEWLKNPTTAKTRAESLVRAIDDPKHGVFQWLQKYW